MIIDIKKAILHILDCNAGVSLMSDMELDMEETGITAYLASHIERVYDDPGIRKGNFNDTSSFKYHLTEYVSGEADFKNFSLHIAERMYETIKNSENTESCDVVIVEAIINERNTICVLKFDNKVGFVHNVSREGDKIVTSIINNYAILPSASQKISNCAFVDAEDYSIRYKGKKITVDGEKIDLIADAVLECVFDISIKESYNAVRKIAKGVADEYGANQIETEARMKKYVKETVASDEDISVNEIAERVFEGLVSAKEDFREKTQKNGVPEHFERNDYVTKKVNENIRLVTDKGIEIRFPSEYYEDDENVSIINNDDGTFSVQINNISKLINK